MKITSIIPTVLLLTSCAIFSHGRDSGSVSPQDIVAGKDKLDGRDVSISGYLILEENSFQLFDDYNSYRKRKYALNCVSLLISQPLFEQFQKLSMKSVVVSGRLRKSISASGLVHLGGCNDVGVEVAEIHLDR
jgi:hypothetical protein